MAPKLSKKKQIFLIKRYKEVGTQRPSIGLRDII